MYKRIFFVLLLFVINNSLIAQESIYKINVLQIDSILEQKNSTYSKVNFTEINTKEKNKRMPHAQILYFFNRQQWNFLTDCCFNGFIRCVF